MIRSWQALLWCGTSNGKGESLGCGDWGLPCLPRAWRSWELGLGSHLSHVSPLIANLWLVQELLKQVCRDVLSTCEHHLSDILLKEDGAGHMNEDLVVSNCFFLVFLYKGFFRDDCGVWVSVDIVGRKPFIAYFWGFCFCFLHYMYACVCVLGGGRYMHVHADTVETRRHY